MKTTRQIAGNTYALTTSDSTTPEILIDNFALGEVFVPNGSSITSLTFWVAPKTGGTYLPAQDTTGAAVTITVAATKAYPIPATVFGAVSMKIVVNSAGSVAITLKS